MALRAVKFHRAMAPYNDGEVAGFAHQRAEELVASGIASFHPPIAAAAAISAAPVVDILTEMDRAQLIAFAAEKLGMADEPPADVDDEALRAAIRGSVDAEALVPAPAKPARKR